MPYSSTEFVLQANFPVCHTVNVTASFQFEIKEDIAVVYGVFYPQVASMHPPTRACQAPPGLLAWRRTF